MTEEEIYKEVFQRSTGMFGGRLDESAHDVSTYPILAEIRKFGQEMVNSYLWKTPTGATEKMPYVHFDLISNTKVNAVAFISEGKEFIGVYSGAILVLQDLFNRLLARQDTFPDVGNPSAEDENPENWPSWVRNFNELTVAYGSGTLTTPPIPKDSYRREYATELLYVALRFLIEHERAHLTNGHVRLMNQLTGQSFILEVDSENKVGMAPLTRQVLEWDADCGAAQTGIERIQAISRKIDSYSLRVPAGALIVWVTGTWCLFRLMGAGRGITTQGDMASWFYPPTSYRQMYCLYMLEAVLQRDYSESLAEFTAATTMSVIPEVERAFFSMTGEKRVDEENFTKDKLSEHELLMDKHWTEVVRPLLEPLAPQTKLSE